MRVGVVGPAFNDSFADNIATCLPAVGATPHLLGSTRTWPLNKFVRRGIAAVHRTFPEVSLRLQRSILQRALDLRLDAVVTVQPDLHPSIVAQLEKEGIRTCVWFPDHVANLERAWVALAPYHALFFKEPVLVKRLTSVLALPAYYLPQACNPKWHRVPDDADVGPCEADGHIVVAGNIYGTRSRLLSMLLDAGIPVKLYGPAVPPQVKDQRISNAHTGRYITRAEKARIFRRSAGVLSSMHPAEIEGVNVRLFEAAGCGAAVLTEHRSEVSNFFRPGQEVLPFSSFDELLGNAKRLIADPSGGRVLGDAATVRAHAEHTYQDRLTRLLEILI